MTSSDIFALLQKIAATASKNEKQALVAQGMQDPLFEQVMKWTYDQGKVFGITAKTIDQLQLPDVPSEGADFNYVTWEILGALADRIVTGRAAHGEIAGELRRLNPESAELFRRILIKDLRAGFSESTINKAKKGTIPEFPYMRCSLPDTGNMDKWNWEDGMLSQEKADGMFVNVDFLGHDYLGQASILIRSRQGTPLPLDELGNVVQAFNETLEPGYQHHGEAVVFDTATGRPLPRELSNGQMNQIASGGKLDPGLHVVVFVWDRVPLEHIQPGGKYTLGYRERLRGLVEALHGYTTTGGVRLIPTRVVRSKKEAMVHCRELLLLGKEGTVVKHPNAIWEDRTSKDQIKLKLQVDVDLRIKAIVPGRVGTKNEGRPGSLTCETEDGHLRVDVTVKNEAMRNDVEKSPGNWLEKITTVRANLVLEPSESSPLHSLFLPRMVEAAVRTDKATADTLQQVHDQFRNAVEMT